MFCKNRGAQMIVLDKKSKLQSVKDLSFAVHRDLIPTSIFKITKESDLLQLMAAERIENLDETTSGYNRKALFYINGKFDTATQKFVSWV